MARKILRQNNPYSTGKVTTFTSTPSLLERGKLAYTPTLDDELYEVTEGEDLTTIAGLKYADSKYWWVIADANDIENPLDITGHNSLIIPNLERIKKIFV